MPLTLPSSLSTSSPSPHPKKPRRSAEAGSIVCASRHPPNSLRASSPCPQQPTSPPQNPNAPNLRDTVVALAGNRLTLHNNILTLICENDLNEASFLIRNSIYSNCRPTVFTCNAILAALLHQSR
ncbi:hypothetical protein MRB53_020013 [Persea americana]|uniref:Uncharacterized protein n=1 Tax=Persea americana TaxID=3435 RepID=A0ACC2L0M8_PERAE|nr:hypothetical protein MRB53_020013 [Persea americana]